MNPITSKRDVSADFFDIDCEWENRIKDSDYLYKGRISAFVKEKDAEEVSGLRAIRQGDVLSSWSRLVERGVNASRDYFLRTQNPEGYWWAELESNVTITSEYIMLLYLLEILNPEEAAGMVKYLLDQQRPDGSWGLYYGDNGDLSTTIEAYFAMKLVGEDPESDPMRRARAFILERGGIESARVFTKIWLALFSQYDWDNVPSMPVELVLLPESFYFNIYEFSSWARGTIVPLSIVLAIRPRYTLPEEHSVSELYPAGASMEKKFPSCTHKLFYLFDRIAKAFERNPIPSLRNRAVHAAETWILDHQEETGDWGGIQPPMVYSVLALHYLGYPLDEPVIVKGLKALRDFCIEDEGGLRMQSCISPVWDTALNCLAMH
ncbi:MAG: prenyltransferase/squalene oxidase repeat-containing protein, partial [Acidobacteriota bacterium]